VAVDPTIPILIADDQRSSRDILSKALEAADRRIVVARDGEEAVACLEREPFDVVITDLKMPGIGGLEVFAHAIDSLPGVQVVFITGYGSLETVMGAIQKGAYDFVAKPFKLAEIQLVVRNACDKVVLMRQVETLEHQLSVAERRERPPAPLTAASPMALPAAHARPYPANRALIGEYRRAAQDGWTEADARLALERLRTGGEISEEEFVRLEERLLRAGQVR
jgi:CheY-like chemotaxis protein